jgi:uncharacterized membrane protein YczE
LFVGADQKVPFSVGVVQKVPFSVIPAKVGIHNVLIILTLVDSLLRGGFVGLTPFLLFGRPLTLFDFLVIPKHKVLSKKFIFLSINLLRQCIK